MSRLLGLLPTAAALTLGACGGGSGDPAPASSQPAVGGTTPAAAVGSGEDCTAAPVPGGGEAVPCPTRTLAPGRRAAVRLATSEGTFEVTLDTRRAPVTANAFAYLAKRGFYDGLIFHRVVKGFVIQGGDPAGDGSGGPGFSVTEAPPSDLRYVRGVVAMAKAGSEPAGTSGSQFFVVTAPDVGLPPDYALVGRVTRGLRTVDRIAALSQGDGVPPKREIRIRAATLRAG